MDFTESVIKLMVAAFVINAGVVTHVTKKIPAVTSLVVIMEHASTEPVSAMTVTLVICARLKIFAVITIVPEKELAILLLANVHVLLVYMVHAFQV